MKRVTDPAFRKYGAVIKGYDFSELIKVMKSTPLPEDVVYVPTVPELEALPIYKEVEMGIYGQLPIQIGYCNGQNKLMNALEYHRDSEVNVAVTDLVLLVGDRADVDEEYGYDTDKAEAYFVPAGTAIEVYATTLHYAPCHTENDGFRCVVILPRDTNTNLDPFEPKSREDQLLFAKNKWLIGHEDGGLPSNAFIGLRGRNISSIDFES